ncbi:MAG: hypothetical protein FWB77_00565 [Treponema sp.]|nr:hypothetical protein [Treponema sp.]
MKIKYIFFVILIFHITAGIQAQSFKPFETFRVIKTDYFDIIFPKESEPSARLLALYADSLYRDVTSILGIEVSSRISVTFTPHTDMFNGYYSHMSFPHIMLYDTPMDIEWTVYENNLKGLFLHELVHAVTISTGNRNYINLQKIFGTWASPAYLTAPLFMIEGATVSFESLTGFGRANDPLIKQKLRQAIYEDKFLTPFQVSGVYDLPDQIGTYYEYGGLFSAWLQKEFGIEKYGELWRAMGDNKDISFSFFVYRSVFYSAFAKVYGINIMDAWNAFKASLSLTGIEEKPNEVLPARYRLSKKRNNIISKIAAGKDNVYILDSTEKKIRVFNSQTENVTSFNTNSFYSYDLDVSECGSKLLVSGYNAIGDMFKAAVTEHNAGSGRITGRSIRGLYKARYFREGAVGIKSEQHNNCIVYMDFKGHEEIIFRGNETLMFSGPQVLDNDRIVFIAAQNGIRKLMLYNYETGELFRVENSAGNNTYWHYMRGLGVFENKLLFSYNSDDRMYKLACLDFDSMQAVFSERDFSGGVFNPVSVNGNIYYSGNLFSGDEFLRFPETADLISGTRIDIALVSQPAADFGLTVKNNIDETPSPMLTENNLLMPSKPYLGISYMNPFKFWLPLPLIRANAADTVSITVDGGGIFSVLMDPTDTNMIMFFAYYDVPYKMLRLESFSWESTTPGIPVTLNFSDTAEIDLLNSNPYRSTQLTLSASFIHTPARISYGLSLGGGYSRIARNKSGNSELSAYNWDETGSIFFYSAAFSISNRVRRQHELFGTGFSLSLRAINIVDSFKPRFEGLFRISAEKRIPYYLALYGAYDKSRMNLQGESFYYSGSLYSDFASEEYLYPLGDIFEWIAGGEIGINIFSLEIQKNLSHVYYNRLRGTLSLRNLLYDSQGALNAEGIIAGKLHLAQSLIFKLGLVTSMVPLTMSPIFIEPYIWAAWKFSNNISGKDRAWSFGFNFNLQF